MTIVTMVRRLIWPTGAGAFRLWLALVVVFHHVTRIEIGKAPVLVFFALSGFWVHRVWQSQYSRTRQAWLTFLVSRWWRIAPILMLAGMVCVPLLWFTHDPDRALVAAEPIRQAICGFAVLGYSGLATRPVGPAWSLDIEMQFYLVAPLLVALVRRVSPVMVLVPGFGVFLAAMVWGAGVSLPSFLPFFLIGMVAAEARWQPPKALAHGGLALAIGLTMAAVLVPGWGALVHERAMEAAVFNMALGLLAIPFAMTTVARKPDRLDGVMADQSYLVYMLHWPAIVLLRYIVWAGPVWRMLGEGALLAAVGVACHFIWLWLDRPLNRLRKRWVASRMVAALPESLPAKRGDIGVHFA